MGQRMNMAKALAAGTLLGRELETALANPIVISMSKSIQDEAKVITKKRKVGKDG